MCIHLLSSVIKRFFFYLVAWIGQKQSRALSLVFLVLAFGWQCPLSIPTRHCPVSGVQFHSGVIGVLLPLKPGSRHFCLVPLILNSVLPLDLLFFAFIWLCVRVSLSFCLLGFFFLVRVDQHHHHHQDQAIPCHIFALTPDSDWGVGSRFFALGVYRLSTLSKKRDIKAYIISVYHTPHRSARMRSRWRAVGGGILHLHSGFVSHNLANGPARAPFCLSLSPRGCESLYAGCPAGCSCGFRVSSATKLAANKTRTKPNPFSLRMPPIFSFLLRGSDCKLVTTIRVSGKQREASSERVP